MKAIGFLCYIGEPIWRLLTQRGAIVALHKACPVKREDLENLDMDLETVGLALFDELFKDEAESKIADAAAKSNFRAHLAKSLGRGHHWGISNSPKIAELTRHIFKWMQANPLDKAGHKAKLLWIGETGHDQCFATKQEIVEGIWGSIRGLDVYRENAVEKKMHLYISNFKATILEKIRPVNAHNRVAWGITLQKQRHVDGVLLDKDYQNNSVANNVNEALVSYDAHYNLHGMLDFLREGLKDPKNQLSGPIAELAAAHVASDRFTDADRASMNALFMDANNGFTDFALFCVLVHLGYIQMKQDPIV